MPNFKGKSGGGPSAMKMYGKGKNPIMMKNAKPDYIDIDKDGNKTESMKDAASGIKMYGKKSAVKNYKKGYYGA